MLFASQSDGTGHIQASVRGPKGLFPENHEPILISEIQARPQIIFLNLNLIDNTRRSISKSLNLQIKRGLAL